MDKRKPEAGRYVETNGLQMHYEEHGSGIPLVLIHGGLVASSSWHSYVERLSENFRIILPDSRGHGKTKNPSGEYSYPKPEEMVGFFDALQLKEPLVCGFSDGRQVAQELGMRHSIKMPALVIAAAYFKWSDRYQDSLRAICMQGRGDVDRNCLKNVIRFWSNDFRQFITREMQIIGKHYCASIP